MNEFTNIYALMTVYALLFLAHIHFNHSKIKS